MGLRWRLTSERLGHWRHKIAAYILAGVAVTWGVAWGCHLRHGEFEFQRGSDRPEQSEFIEGDRVYYVYTWDREGKTTLFVNRYPTGWPADPRRQGSRPSSTFGIDISSGAVMETYGAPWRALRRGRTWKPFEEVSVGRTPLPVGLLPLGFTLNTLLAAGVLMGVVEGVGFARRRASNSPPCG